ncbi:MAG: CoA transferase [Dehalococcoidia bacterium]
MIELLKGLRILDLTQYEAGTSATQMLAWLGADVVKVEAPGIGDPGRGLGAQPNGQALDRWYFLNLNGNKRSVTIDLKQLAGRDLFFRLAPKFDVFVENLGPGTVENLGLGYERLRAAHSSIIYATLKGFGNSGQYARFKSFDMVAQAVGGAMSLTGTSATEPLRSGVTWGDTGTGMHMAIGILAAYTHKLRTGEGAHIEVSMQDAIANYARIGFLAREVTGDPVPRGGNNLKGLAPTDTYPCKPFGPNDFVYVVAVSGRMVESLLIAIGHPELCDDPRVANAMARRENNDWLHELLTEWCGQRTKHEAMAELQACGVPAGAVFDSGDIFNDAHMKSREMVQVVNHPTRGDVEILGNPVRADGEATRLVPAPLLGEHTDEVLCGELGLTPGEIEELRTSRVV